MVGISTERGVDNDSRSHQNWGSQVKPSRSSKARECRKILYKSAPYRVTNLYHQRASKDGGRFCVENGGASAWDHLQLDGPSTLAIMGENSSF